MKVVYEKPSIEKIKDAIAEAKREGKKIERIELGEGEYSALVLYSVGSSPIMSFEIEGERQRFRRAVKGEFLCTFMGVGIHKGEE